MTHGFVGADLAALAREAAMKALRRYLPDIDLDKPIPAEILEKMRVTATDFKDALKEVEPSAMRRSSWRFQESAGRTLAVLKTSR